MFPQARRRPDGPRLPVGATPVAPVASRKSPCCSTCAASPRVCSRARRSASSGSRRSSASMIAHVIDDRTRRPVFLMDRDPADRAHVDEQILGHFGEQRAAAHPDDRLMKGDVRIRIFGEPLALAVGPWPVPAWNAAISRRKSAISASPARSAASRAAMLSSAAMTVIISTISRFDLAHDKDAAARAGADKAFLLEHGHRLADRRAADAQPLRQPPLVEPDLVRAGRRCPSR